MKKGWQVLLSASVLAGVVGSLFIRKNRGTDSSRLEELKNKYVGKWQFNNNHKKNHTLTISKKFELAIDEQPVKGLIIELNKDNLIVQDKYGYQIKILTNGNNPVSVYDEADDATYILDKIG
ncbi:MAG: DUF4828 domain-containing protein [Lactobacillales bacterium]|nr:DUF4828 domain-containing protein [Lactobacillales bacterium]